jgi:rare lipoprotein A
MVSKPWLSMLVMAIVPVALPARAAVESPPPVAVITGEVGVASYYGAGFHRMRTASGERFDMQRMTAAHRTLPFGTRVRITNLRNGRSAIVHINDRGPFVKGRMVDVSYAAARRLRMLRTGAETVRLEVLGSLAQRPSGESG